MRFGVRAQACTFLLEYDDFRVVRPPLCTERIFQYKMHGIVLRARFFVYAQHMHTVLARRCAASVLWRMDDDRYCACVRLRI